MPFIRERCCSGDVLDDALWVDRAKVIWWPRWFSGSDWLLDWLCRNVFHVSLAFVADQTPHRLRGGCWSLGPPRPRRALQTPAVAGRRRGMVRSPAQVPVGEYTS